MFSYRKKICQPICTLCVFFCKFIFQPRFLLNSALFLVANLKKFELRYEKLCFSETISNFVAMKRELSILSLVLATAFLLSPLFVSAQFVKTIKSQLIKETKEASDSTVLLETVSVSAAKVGNDVKSAGIPATVISFGQVERNAVVSPKSAAELVPNMFIPDYGSRMTSTIYVRGLGARIDQPVIGLNIDNVPIMNKDNYDMDLPDIARIEALRGPQSTLFGRNTMGGVLNIYTLSPFDYQGFRMNFSFSSGTTFRFATGNYRKFSDKFALSFSRDFISTQGFFTNEFNGKKCDKDRSHSFRLKLQYRPTNRLSIDNVATLGLTKQGGYPYEYLETGTISYNDTCFYRRTTFSDGITINYRHNKFTLSSVTTGQYSNDNMTLDQDFTPLSYFTLTQKRKEYALTQELIARSAKKSNYSWLTGAFGFYRNSKITAPVTFKDYGIYSLIESRRNAAIPEYPIEWDSREFELGSDFRISTYGVALFHQSSYKLNNFTFTVGLRGDFERSVLTYHSSSETGYTIYHSVPGAPKEVFRHDDVSIHDSETISKSFFELLPRFSVVYTLPNDKNSNVYFNVSKGYKAGGFNTQMFSDVLQQRIMRQMGIGMSYDVDEIVGYKPEKAWTYELGSYLSLLSNRVNANLTAFYTHCTDQQLTIFPDGTTTGRIMTNAGKTRSFGVELSLSSQITNRVSFNATYGYTNAKFIEFNNGKQDFSGKFIPYAPRNTIFAEAIYSHPIENKILRSLSIGVNTRCVGDIYWNEENTVKQPFYALLGSSIKLTGKYFSFELWGKNLTNTAFGSFYFVSIGHDFIQRGKPRQLGVTLKLHI